MAPDDTTADPVDHYDSAADDEDNASASTFNDSDLAALDAEIAADDANLVSHGYSADDPFATRSVPIQVKYAPKAWLYPTEKYWPATAKTFLNHTQLFFAHDRGCKDDWKADSPSGGSLAAANYGTREEYPRHNIFHTCGRFGNNWYTNDENVAVDASGGPGGRDGFYVGLWSAKPDIKDGKGFNGKEKIYWDIDFSSNPNRSGWYYYEYWYFYAYNAPPYPTAGGDHHQGDWEHVSILFDPNLHPRMVNYNAHEYSCNLSWKKAPKVPNSSHIKIWMANGTHGIYPAAGSPPPIKKAGVTVYDTISDAGNKIWYGNKSTVVPAYAQNWWGYYGNWGNIGTYSLPEIGKLDRTGPTGPSELRDEAEPKWSDPICKFA